MAKPKGHKSGCKCVACSPATRKAGQKALEAHRKGKAGAKGKGKSPRKNASTPAAEQPAPKKPVKRRPKKRGSGGQRQAAAPAAAKRETVERFANVPPEVFEAKGGYLVLHGSEGRKVQGVKLFRTLVEVREFVGGLKKGFAVATDLRATARA